MRFVGSPIACLAVLLLPSSLSAQPPDNARSETLDAITSRARTIMQFDRAAWVTSDDLVTRLPASRHSEIGGWVVTPAARGVHVDYFGKDQTAQRALYSADVIDGTVQNAKIFPTDALPALGAAALAAQKALSAARAELQKHRDWQSCAPAPFNTVILPRQEDGTTPVYFMTPQTRTDLIPFGGHYRIDIAADGSAAGSRAFTKACFNAQIPAQGGQQKLEVLVLTHLLDPHPTEMHVFQQAVSGLPLTVATVSNEQQWHVEDGRITNMGPIGK